MLMTALPVPPEVYTELSHIHETCHYYERFSGVQQRKVNVLTITRVKRFFCEPETEGACLMIYFQ
jgi:hypothetical protein